MSLPWSTSAQGFKLQIVFEARLRPYRRSLTFAL